MEKVITMLIEVPEDVYERIAKNVKSPIVFPKQVGEEIIAEVRRSFLQTDKNLQK